LAQGTSPVTSLSLSEVTMVCDLGFRICVGTVYLRRISNIIPGLHTPSSTLDISKDSSRLKQNANEPAWRSTASDMSCSRTRTAEIRQTVWSVAVASLMLSRSQIWAGLSLGFPTRLCLVSHSSIFVTLYHVCFMYRYIQYYSLCIRCSMGPSHETRKEQDVAPMELLKKEESA
jgi:hypothetical protein